MASTSKNGMVVTSSIHTAPRTMQGHMVISEAAPTPANESTPMQTAQGIELTWPMVFKISVGFGVGMGVAWYVLWGLVHLTLHGMGK